ncbi:MAG TPA: NnrS family protein [Candidatus Polarisedimenticolia bacterium]|nr:NnrS family protein [Candidatus Polarisedimenticolia bacterium]
MSAQRPIDPSHAPPAMHERGVPGPTALLAAAPAWRREPYRIFFPLGALLAWAGVLHWFLHATGLLANYEPVFHSIAQIQGFMMSFAVGFLMTAIPRRTGTAPPAAWQMFVGLAAPVGATIAAWYERWAISQVFWFALVVMLIGFAVRRFVSAEAARRPPNSFIWVPLSLLMGAVGSVLIAVGAARGPDSFWLHDLGKLLLLQGMFIGLIVGVGGMVLPLLTRGDAPPDASGTSRDQLVRVGHIMAALALAASFWIEVVVSQTGGLAIRAVLTLGILIVSGRIHRPPSVPGFHRRLVWLSAWMIPAGYALAALFPTESRAGLHVVLIGGFALMALSVGLHVTMAHGGHQSLVKTTPWQVPVYGALILAATAARAMVDFDRPRFFTWLGLSAALFLVGTLVWGALMARCLLSRPAAEAGS